MNIKNPIIYIIFLLLFLLMFFGDSHSKIYFNNILIIFLFFIYLLYRSTEYTKIRKMKEKYNLIRAMNNQLKIASYKDPLTSTYNRRALEDWFSRNKSTIDEYKTNFSIIYFDIDNFKDVNDVYGHKEGDKVLMNMSEEIKKMLRKTDFLVRLGGEEFCFFCFEDEKEAYKIAERIKENVRRIKYGKEQEITCSIGVTKYRAKEPLETLIDRADQAMYKAKTTGKDRVELLI